MVRTRKEPGRANDICDGTVPYGTVQVGTITVTVRYGAVPYFIGVLQYIKSILFTLYWLTLIQIHMNYGPTDIMILMIL